METQTVKRRSKEKNRMTSVHIIISGFVQGVGFRKFVHKEGRRLGLSGWVQNLHNGTVEVNAIGEREKLEELIEKCKKGSYFAEVDDVSVEWGEEDSGDDFFIL